MCLVTRIIVLVRLLVYSLKTLMMTIRPTGLRLVGCPFMSREVPQAFLKGRIALFIACLLCTKKTFSLQVS
jgi:hypothetical protein